MEKNYSEPLVRTVNCKDKTHLRPKEKKTLALWIKNKELKID